MFLAQINETQRGQTKKDAHEPLSSQRWTETNSIGIPFRLQGEVDKIRTASLKAAQHMDGPGLPVISRENDYTNVSFRSHLFFLYVDHQ
jgi:hypothetical protein